jgi:DNA transposition AAA+ family ATPase
MSMNNTIDHATDSFIETKEYRRFKEFCDNCRRYRYIGLCYGPPGVGKTLSASRYANWDKVRALRLFLEQEEAAEDIYANDVIVYTPSVINTPKQIDSDIAKLRNMLRYQYGRSIHKDEAPMVAAARQHYDAEYRRFHNVANGSYTKIAEYNDAEDNFMRRYTSYNKNIRSVSDPTELILVDEADRIKVSGLEQLRDIFDRGGIGIVLIGMPGIEKRLARYPQLYSRVGFVHEFRRLSTSEMRELLIERRWLPSDVAIANGCLDDEEGTAAILRAAGGNFRLLQRLLTQIARILEINQIDSVTTSVVEAARESLVIGTA